MDKKEAILRIRDHIAVHHIGEGCHIKIFEALCMAIEALEKSQWTKEGHQIDIEKPAQNILDRVQQKLGISAEQLMDLAQAYQDGRCVVLSEPMKPMVYKPGDTDVYCPNCGETLSGGWMLSDADDYRKLCQCPKCGQSIDDTKCEAAEAALKGEQQ